jgi:hypothetical protein
MGSGAMHVAIFEFFFFKKLLVQKYTKNFGYFSTHEPEVLIIYKLT